MGGRRIVLDIGSVGPVEVALTGRNLRTAQALWDNLPAGSSANLWGDEVYLELPFEHPAEDARAEVEVGDVAWWPAGSCLCLFFGPTPASPGDAPVAASPVNVIGRMLGDTGSLEAVGAGDSIYVRRKDVD